MRLSRRQFCQLTGMSPDVLKDRSRRGLMPFSLGQPKARKSYGYSLVDAYMTVLMEHLIGSWGIKSSAAVAICNQIRPALEPRLPDILKRDKEKRLLREFNDIEMSVEDIEWQLVWYPDGEICSFVGTPRDIASAIGERPKSDIIGGTAMLAAQHLLDRAHQLGIYLPLGGESA